MKLLLFTLLLGTSILFSNCKKSDDVNNTHEQTLNAIQGSWTLTKRICYENPTMYILFPAGLTWQFNSDLTGSVTWNGGGGSTTTFSYNLLSDNTTLIFQYAGGNIDTSVITSLTTSKFVFHGVNTYAHISSPCINSNTLDSLYR